ncbi:spindle and kinetochore-associated protein 3 isoform X2 [Lepisosteus oculatus]|uniref:spindle and kinetochore-associated protein 3 isoform X2 n=1 Tax=Lepisosteus oculatus TaxID=7918 RepID=UPI0035F51A24
MDISGHFFKRLRDLVVFLETETQNLEKAHQNNDYDSDEGGVQVLHELHSEVRAMKEQVRTQLLGCQPEEEGVRDFISTSSVLRQRLREDIGKVRRHFEDYGYTPPPKNPEAGQGGEEGPGKRSEGASGQEAGTEPVAAEEDKPPCTTPEKSARPAPDPLRTPQLSDFGLSEYCLLRNRGAAEAGDGRLGSVVPAAAEPRPAFPQTPRCDLRLDSAPRSQDFGISEHTVSLNNDFTMALFQKKADKPASVVDSSRPGGAVGTGRSPCMPVQPSVSKPVGQNDALVSPEPPEFCTPGFKISKLRHPPMNPKTPERTKPAETCSSTPEVPAFETPFLKSLIHRPEPCTPGLPKPPRPHIDHKTPERTQPAETCSSTPEVPAFETPFLKSLIHSGMSNADNTETGPMEETFTHLRSRTTGKLTCEAAPGGEQKAKAGRGTAAGLFQMRQPSPPALGREEFTFHREQLHPFQGLAKPFLHVPPRPAFLITDEEKENSVQRLATVSEKEYLVLPNYLKQIHLANLNMAIHKINMALDSNHIADSPEYLMKDADLKNIIDEGPKVNIYILCLMELNRLKVMRNAGAGNVYKVILDTDIQ